MALDIEYVSKGRDLPSSFGEMKLLREMVDEQPELADLTNTMALVPNCPEIVQQIGISRERANRKLFAVGRKTNHDYASKHDIEGRYTIWISGKGNYSYASWVSETELQIILKQIGGFDPSTQPLAFPDAADRSREEEERKEKIQAKFRENSERVGRKSPKGRLADGGAPDAGMSGRLQWLFIGLPILALLLWLALFVAGRRGKP